MTVCIAARFSLGTPYVEEPIPAFVLCSDGRLSGGEWGSDNVTSKTHTLGYNYLALMGGHWNTVRDMCSQLEKDILAGPMPQTKADLAQRIEKSVTLFSGSALCQNRVGCEAIITGFIKKESVMMRVGIQNRKPTFIFAHDRDEIGEGAFAATMMLKHRGYDPLNMDLATACYLVYEAKKFSETVDSVGTWLKIHTRGDNPPAPNEHCYMDINSRGLKQLEEWRRKLFLQSVGEIKGTLFSAFY